jgi:hypothetical protein
MLEIFIGPAGMFEHWAKLPPLTAVVDEPLELQAASPRASTAPTAIGTDLWRRRSA